MTLLASLFANSILPSSPAIGPSALLPSQCQTTFHAWPAAMTPGIAIEGAGAAGSGGGCRSAGDGWPPPIRNAGGGVAHFATTAAVPGFCQAC